MGPFFLLSWVQWKDQECGRKVSARIHLSFSKSSMGETTFFFPSVILFVKNISLSHSVWNVSPKEQKTEKKTEKLQEIIWPWNLQAP